ncbi:hypothetical protein ACJX0J_029495 [Zea mays]
MKLNHETIGLLFQHHHVDVAHCNPLEYVIPIDQWASFQLMSNPRSISPQIKLIMFFIYNCLVLKNFVGNTKEMARSICTWENASEKQSSNPLHSNGHISFQGSFTNPTGTSTVPCDAAFNDTEEIAVIVDVIFNEGNVWFDI